MINKAYEKTINEFTRLLIRFEIPFSIKYFLGGANWRFPFCEGDFICNIAVHNSSLVESMHMPWDKDDVTQMEPDEAISKLIHFYCKDIYKKE